MTRAARFTSADIARAVKAAEKCGLCVAGVRFTPNGFEIVVGQPEEQDNTNWFSGSPLYKDAAA